MVFGHIWQPDLDPTWKFVYREGVLIKCLGCEPSWRLGCPQPRPRRRAPGSQRPPRRPRRFRRWAAPATAGARATATAADLARPPLWSPHPTLPSRCGATGRRAALRKRSVPFCISSIEVAEETCCLFIQLMVFVVLNVACKPLFCAWV
jgi:hypothetical protein